MPVKNPLLIQQVKDLRQPQPGIEEFSFQDSFLGRILFKKSEKRTQQEVLIVLSGVPELGVDFSFSGIPTISILDEKISDLDYYGLVVKATDMMKEFSNNELAKSLNQEKHNFEINYVATVNEYLDETQKEKERSGLVNKLSFERRKENAQLAAEGAILGDLKQIFDVQELSAFIEQYNEGRNSILGNIIAFFNPNDTKKRDIAVQKLNEAVQNLNTKQQRKVSPEEIAEAQAKVHTALNDVKVNISVNSVMGKILENIQGRAKKAYEEMMENFKGVQERNKKYNEVDQKRNYLGSEIKRLDGEMVELKQEEVTIYFDQQTEQQRQDRNEQILKVDRTIFSLNERNQQLKIQVNELSEKNKQKSVELGKLRLDENNEAIRQIAKDVSEEWKNSPRVPRKPIVSDSSSQTTGNIQPMVVPVINAQPLELEITGTSIPDVKELTSFNGKLESIMQEKQQQIESQKKQNRKLQENIQLLQQENDHMEGTKGFSRLQGQFNNDKPALEKEVAENEKKLDELQADAERLDWQLNKVRPQVERVLSKTDSEFAYAATIARTNSDENSPKMRREGVLPMSEEQQKALEIEAQEGLELNKFKQNQEKLSQLKEKLKQLENSEENTRTALMTAKRTFAESVAKTRSTDDLQKDAEGLRKEITKLQLQKANKFKQLSSVGKNKFIADQLDGVWEGNLDISEIQFTSGADVEKRTENLQLEEKISFYQNEINMRQKWESNVGELATRTTEQMQSNSPQRNLRVGDKVQYDLTVKTDLVVRNQKLQKKVDALKQEIEDLDNFLIQDKKGQKEEVKKAQSETKQGGNFLTKFLKKKSSQEGGISDNGNQLGKTTTPTSSK